MFLNKMSSFDQVIKNLYNRKQSCPFPFLYLTLLQCKLEVMHEYEEKGSSVALILCQASDELLFQQLLKDSKINENP